ncbi:carboxylesterase family protein [Vibrio comitans]|uniref:Carboxylesterase type B domain-containing protein n=1 Tax=Vibrio comitans NBRC 102076 TaxID=1219078 RepID=A0A4Y3IJS5_9VIBR|nr:carboxylesterase family protein [Vibrio comitans]GEA59198.1 hypothetical protein VCO01S_03910 [Vibrio comitans NBRC 102076]
MTLLHRSLLAIAISTTLSACYTDVDPTVPFPIEDEPLKPLPTETIERNIGDSIVSASKESVVITATDGKEKLVSIESFKGIEYATQTRFVHSMTKELDEVVDATDFGAACMQVRATVQEQSEDCLNLNIWRPANVEAGAELPVYVFIHGGDFEYGSGSEALVHGDTVVAQGSDDGKPFIYVSLNYRLGQLGTMWREAANEDEDEYEDGNYGISDQKNALEWVHLNIDKFGGDTGNVTVMGQGSGAMSIGFLQQDERISGQYFQRAIMQSNPYGFEYPSYEVAKARKEDFDAETPIADIMASQQSALDGISQLINWVSGSINLNPFASTDNTPMSHLMPFSPYISCDKLEDQGSLLPPFYKTVCIEHAESPIQSGLSVPSVLGSNAHEANSFGMLFSATFLAPIIIDIIFNSEPELLEEKDSTQMALALVNWLEDENNVQKVKDKLSSLTADDLSNEPEMPMTAYSAVTNLFYGAASQEETERLANGEDVAIAGHEQVQDILNLTDFYPNSEAELGGAIANMSQFKMLLNDTLFNGPNRYMATNFAPAIPENDMSATLYRFDKKPSFNMWNFKTGLNEETGEYDELSIIDLFKTIGCISGACNGSELPFVFNKAVRFDGSEIHPTSNEKAMMNEMSRLWFSEELFTNYQYSDATDNVLVIESQGFSESTTYDWDYVTNPGMDPKLREGRLTGLEEQGLMPWQWYLN